MSFHIRDVELADSEAICAIYAHHVTHGTASFELDAPNQAEIVRRINTITEVGYPYVVAIDDVTGKVLGYAYASSYRARPAYRWTVENSVYIDAAAQGRGLGKALTAHIVERCTALGFRQMIAVIGGSDHAASIAMHASLGFTHVGNLPATGFKHGRWLDSVLMQLPLGDGAHTAPDADQFPGTLYP